MKRKLLLVMLASSISLIGCTIQLDKPESSIDQPQNTNQDQSANDNQNKNNSGSDLDEVGQTKTVGNLTVTIKGVRESMGNDTSPTKNEQYIILDATITNNGDEKIGLYGDDIILTDQNGRKAEAQYNPYGVTEVNYVTTTIPPRTKMTRGVLVFDTFKSSTYTLTINQGGGDDKNSATWTIQP